MTDLAQKTAAGAPAGFQDIAAAGIARFSAISAHSPSAAAAAASEGLAIARMQLAVKFEFAAPTPEEHALEALAPLLAAAAIPTFPFAPAHPAAVKKLLPSPCAAIELNKACAPSRRSGRRKGRQAAEAAAAAASATEPALMQAEENCLEKTEAHRRDEAWKAEAEWRAGRFACFELEGADRLPTDALSRAAAGVYFLYSTGEGANGRSRWLLKDVWIVMRRSAALSMTTREAAAAVLAGLAACVVAVPGGKKNGKTDGQKDEKEDGKHQLRFRKGVRLVERRMQGVPADCLSPRARYAKRPADGFMIVPAACRALLQNPTPKPSFDKRWLLSAPYVFDSHSLSSETPAGLRLRRGALEELAAHAAAGAPNEPLEPLRGVRLFIGMPSLREAVAASWLAAEAARGCAPAAHASLDARCLALKHQQAPALQAHRLERFAAAVRCFLLAACREGSEEAADGAAADVRALREAGEAAAAARSLLAVAEDACFGRLLHPKGRLALPHLLPLSRWTPAEPGMPGAKLSPIPDQIGLAELLPAEPLPALPGAAYAAEANPRCLRSLLIGRLAAMPLTQRQKSALAVFPFAWHAGTAIALAEAGIPRRARLKLLPLGRMIRASDAFDALKAQDHGRKLEHLAAQLAKRLKQTTGGLFLSVLDQLAQVLRQRGEPGSPVRQRKALAAAERWLRAGSPDAEALAAAEAAFRDQAPLSAELYGPVLAAASAAALSWAADCQPERASERCLLCRLCEAAKSAESSGEPFAAACAQRADAIRESAPLGLLAQAAQAFFGEGELRSPHAEWQAFAFALRRIASGWDLDSAELADALGRELHSAIPRAAKKIEAATASSAGRRAELAAQAERERLAAHGARRLLCVVDAAAAQLLSRAGSAA